MGAVLERFRAGSAPGSRAWGEGELNCSLQTLGRGRAGGEGLQQRVGALAI